MTRGFRYNLPKRLNNLNLIRLSMVRNLLSAREIRLYQAWLLNPKNIDIAREFGVTEAYVSKTLKKIREKINSLGTSISQLQAIGLIEPISPVSLSEEGAIALARRNMAELSKSLNDITNLRPTHPQRISNVGTNERIKGRLRKGIPAAKPEIDTPFADPTQQVADFEFNQFNRLNTFRPIDQNRMTVNPSSATFRPPGVM
jgi:DNA-binding CsgD family transcriptional regulator